MMYIYIILSPLKPVMINSRKNNYVYDAQYITAHIIYYTTRSQMAGIA